MENSITFTQPTRKTVRMRGWQIRARMKDWTSSDTGLMWLSAPPLEQWQEIISDPEVRWATLIRSGRTYLNYDPIRQRAELAPMNGSQQGFSLMR